MFVRRVPIAVLVGVLLVASACADEGVVSGAATRMTTLPSEAEGAGTDPESSSSTGVAPRPTTITSRASTTTSSPPPTSTSPPATTVEATTTTSVAPTSTTVPTSVVPALPVFDPACVVEVAAGDSLSRIADRFDDDTVTVPSIRTENGVVGDNIDPGDYLDVCVANGLNDITGEQRTEADAVAVATLTAVEAQQRQLNVLFAGLGTPELLVDGISGPVTRQRLCAARLALGLPISTADMLAGSPEEQALMAATTLPIPFTSAILSERWILIDQTCQIMFVGEGTTRLTFVFPTSTGEPGHETRDQDRSRAFRFNPALANGGWHNSTTYPAADDNPLNGNMYKPIYFDRGQAIHGANNVPTNPQSKGCARLRVEHQELLIGGLGLGDVTSEIRNADRINVTVNAQGSYVPA
jgi:LysM repeat protein